MPQEDRGEFANLPLAISTFKVPDQIFDGIIDMGGVKAMSVSIDESDVPDALSDRRILPYLPEQFERVAHSIFAFFFLVSINYH